METTMTGRKIIHIFLDKKLAVVNIAHANSKDVGWVLWHINLSRWFNAKSIFMKIVLFQTIQFSMTTQYNCQKHFYFKQFKLFKQF